MTTLAVPSVILLVISLANASVASIPAQGLRELPPGLSVERDLSAGEHHRYRIALVPGQYVEIAVEQRSVDVVIALFGPNGEMIRENDSVKAVQQTETIVEVSDNAGDYCLDIRAKAEDAVGRYVVKVRSLREASARDRYRVGASRAFQQAEELYGRKTAPFLEKAIEKYEEAAALWQAAGDHSREARALLSVGVVYWLFGEFSRALDYSKQAQALWRDAKDQGGEANALNNIGQNFNALGQNQEALNAFHQSLAIYRESGSKRRKLARSTTSPWYTRH
jgi:tetratricopeptide (TPR) repeat protein